MVRTMTLSAIAVLLISSGAFAQIDLQYQNWNFATDNSIELHGGPANASSTQGVGNLSVQNLGINPDGDGNPTATASQGFAIVLFDTKSAETGGAHIGAETDQHVVGLGITVNSVALPAGQTQQVGDLAGPTMQYEGVEVGSHQKVDKGVGSSAQAEALNLVGFGMGQTAGNNCAVGCQASIILGGQGSEIEGAPQSIGEVEANMTTQVWQFQAANGV